jgi:mono/diheme cytochrome c family protein
MLPRPIRWALIALGVLALLPIACIYRARNVTSPRARVHIVQDMDNQPKFRAQRVNPMFADGRAQRPPVAGTVARGQARDDDHFHRGLVDGAFATGFPEASPLTSALLARGRERFDIYCSPCHGLAGYGDGIVGKRADRLQEGTWVPPSNLHDAQVVARADGHLFNTIANGIRTMPAYGTMISERDRWAIVSYVRALQRAQAATIADVPADEKAKLR